MEQPVPEVSHADVVQIVRRDFGVSCAAEILVLLRGFDTSPRVQLAILKLAHGDLDEIKKAGDAAVQDLRDVLSWAEYPRYTREIGFDDVPDEFEREVIASDWKQYQEWLRKA